jgi:nucleoside-diphosphate-sugar epimerase
MSDTPRNVLVTGAAGHIAGHVVRDLFEHGYAVHGTVLDAAAEDKISYLRTFGEIELVAADLTDDACWDALKARHGFDVALETLS